MYGVNLSYSLTEKYLSLLIEQQLIEGIKDSKGRLRYAPTDRGKKFLTLLENLEQLVNGTPKAGKVPQMQGQDSLVPSGVNPRHQFRI